MARCDRLLLSSTKKVKERRRNIGHSAHGGCPSEVQLNNTFNDIAKISMSCSSVPSPLATTASIWRMFLVKLPARF